MKELQAILKGNMVGTLATLNGDGSPWSTPVHIIAVDDEILWFSKPTHQHSQNLLRDPRVSVSLWSTNEGTKGAYLSGRADILEGADAERAFERVQKPDGTLPSVFVGTTVYRLKVGQLNNEKSTDNRWYFYS